MPGAEQVGAAFVDIGGKIEPLGKAFDEAKRVTTSSMNEMGKIAQRAASGMGAAFGKMGIPTSISAVVSRAIDDFTDLESAVARLWQQLPRHYQDAGKAMAMLQKQADAVKKEYRGISDKEIANIAAAFVTAGVPVDDFDKKLRAVIGHASALGIGLQDTTQRMISVWHGAAAVQALKVPIAAEAPAPMQFDAAMGLGAQFFKTEQEKLRGTLSGRMKAITTKISDWWTGQIGFGAVSRGAAEDIVRAADKAQTAATGKTAAQRARRRGFRPGGAAGVLSDTEPAGGATFGGFPEAREGDALADAMRGARLLLRMGPMRPIQATAQHLLGTGDSARTVPIEPISQWEGIMGGAGAAGTDETNSLLQQILEAVRDRTMPLGFQEPRVTILEE